MSAVSFSLSSFGRRGFFSARCVVSCLNGIQYNLSHAGITQRSLCAFPSYSGALAYKKLPYSDTRLFSTTSPSTDNNDNKPVETKPSKASLVQRFKESYAIYGKMVIVIHGLTSCVWFASAYLIASTGLNLLEFFEAAQFPEWACRPLRMGGGAVNTWATTLILYKLIAPLRYGVTLLLTRFAVRYLRAKGKVPQLAERDRLRNLARESAQISRERVKWRISKGRTRMLSMSKKAFRSSKKM